MSKWNIRVTPALDAVRGAVSRPRYIKALLARWEGAGCPALPILTEDDWSGRPMVEVEIPEGVGVRLEAASGGSKVAAVAALVEWGGHDE